jgi:uncharacterized protein
MVRSIFWNYNIFVAIPCLFGILLAWYLSMIPKKSEINRDKHGISLEDIKQLWLGRTVIVDAQPRFDEQRFMRIGKLGKKFYSCVFTIRGETIRLISARRSNKKEVIIYHETIQEQKTQGLGL